MGKPKLHQPGLAQLTDEAFSTDDTIFQEEVEFFRNIKEDLKDENMFKIHDPEKKKKKEKKKEEDDEDSLLSDPEKKKKKEKKKEEDDEDSLAEDPEKKKKKEKKK